MLDLFSIIVHSNAVLHYLRMSGVTDIITVYTVVTVYTVLIKSLYCNYIVTV